MGLSIYLPPPKLVSCPRPWIMSAGWMIIKAELGNSVGSAGQSSRQSWATVEAVQGKGRGSAGQRKRQCRASSSAGATAHKIMPPVGVTSFLYIQLLYGELIFGFLLFCSSPSINKGLNPFYGGNSFNAIFSSLLILLHHLDIQN